MSPEDSVKEMGKVGDRRYQLGVPVGGGTARISDWGLPFLPKM
jgi:hypothetical protein